MVTVGGETLANYRIEAPSIGQDTTVLNDGTFSFYNPVGQVVAISGSGTYAHNFNSHGSIYQGFEEWTVKNGQTVFLGSTSSGGSSVITPPVTTAGRNPPLVGGSNIHAVIISGLSDPA